MLEPSHFIFLLPLLEIIKIASAGKSIKKLLIYLEGRKTDPTFYPVIYGADMDDDWTDPEVWKKANPSLGITVTMDKGSSSF